MCLIMSKLIYLILFLITHSTGFEIVNFTGKIIRFESIQSLFPHEGDGELVAVKQGDPLVLTCEAEPSYKWCIWYHNGKKYNTFSGHKSQATELFAWKRLMNTFH